MVGLIVTPPWAGVETGWTVVGSISAFPSGSVSLARTGIGTAAPGGIHGFRHEPGPDDSGEPASMLILFAPGAPREGYFESLAAIGRGELTLTDEEKDEFYRRHDNLWVDVP